MKMWSKSQNVSVRPPPIRKMSGRSDKNRKKKGEIKKTKKLSKREIEMSCSTCHNKGYNKRKCRIGLLYAGPSSSTGACPSTCPSAVHVHHLLQYLLLEEEEVDQRVLNKMYSS